MPGNMNGETGSELPWDLVGPSSGGLSIGIVLQGTYRILRPLAEGGCGEVYLAAHTRLPGRFAIKLLHRSLVRDNDAMTRFRQEAEITSSLRHPHIVQVFDFNVTDSGVPFLVMELLEGKLLSQRIASAGAVDPVAAVEIVEQTASALHAAHSRGIVHRDLKPENIMLLAGAGVGDFVKVLDFGISQASWRPRLTDGERVAGTPQFMSPEQACGLREQIDHRSDQFSLAAIAYMLLTGREPFRGENPIAVLYEVVHSDPVPPSQIVPELGPEIDAVILRGLAKTSADRYTNVTAFASALRAVVHGAMPLALMSEVNSDPPPVRVTLVDEPIPSQAMLVDAPTPPATTLRGLEPLPIPPRDLLGGVEREPLPLFELREHEPTPRPGRNTQRLLRRMHWRLHRPRRRLAMLTLVLAAGFVWFSPATRAATLAAWHRAGTQMHIMFDRVLPTAEAHP
jgi:serine/threonine protein kinase